MSEKKHAATPRRKEEARKKGQVLKSRDLTSALMLVGLVATLKYWVPHMIEDIAAIFPYVWNQSTDWTTGSVANLLQNLTWMTLVMLAPVLGAAVVLALVGNYLQVGTLFTFEPLKPQLSRINPINGAKRMFGVHAWVEMGKALIKVLLIGYFLYASIRDNLVVFPALQQLSVAQGAVFIGRALLDLAWKIALSFLALSMLDFLYQWWDYEKNLRMSLEELKEEFKQTEGDPQLKAEIRRRQRAMAMRRMMQDLQKADVVVTNPTHFAVALRYDPKEKKAPYVVAKGQDEVARRMRELAQEYGIVVTENKPLARALYAQVEIGQIVPADLYKAVAEVLAFVYRLKKKKIAVR